MRELGLGISKSLPDGVYWEDAWTARLVRTGPVS